MRKSLEAFFSAFFTTAFWSAWKTWLWLYCSFAIASHITLSPADLEGALKGTVALLVFVCLAFLLLGWWTACVHGTIRLQWSAFEALFPCLVFFLTQMGLAALLCRCLVRHGGR